ncbi:65-kDa microtubule-associated protein 3 [Mercurialis annua]|uniref:65-kDa microtubule-associated protein 3 n=1 Tax=Mercurialis annua TaxID=3986 RepID=UPI002160CC63|nr:65-kDa microtubule-associated protein 3 [Mercurialis annua]
MSNQLLQMETTCGSLLYELQIIWDEVGETDEERDKLLLEVEQECLEVYRRKVDHANRNRAQLRQAIADSEAELAAVCSSMGELPVHIRQADQSAGTLKEELQRILPQLEEMRKRKSDRRNQFLEVLEEIQKISNEIYGSADRIFVDETDISLRKLEELHKELYALQKEKSDRLKQVQEHLDTLNSLCLVLGFDFNQTLNEVHSSFGNTEGSRNISTVVIQNLATAIIKLREVKIQRMQKLQDLATTMLELWHLMDTPIEEQQVFQNITCNIAAAEHEINEPNTLSVDFINNVQEEVIRLEQLKSSKMKDLVLKKRSELEEICRKTHMVPELDTAIQYAVEAIESGNVDPAGVLEKIELQIGNVKEEAFSRKEILEKVEKWLVACEEECWLEEYNRDENRYNAGRGAHLTLKRAEKARALVNKLPGMVEALALKTIAWEKERDIQFLYDGVRLLSMLEEYNILRQEKEEERRRQRDQKKLQGQLIAEQEALYGSKPSPSKTGCAKKVSRISTGGVSNRRLSLGGAMHQTTTPHSRPGKKLDRMNQHDPVNHRQDDGFSALSAGRRGLDIAGLPAKKHPFSTVNAVNAHEPESPMLRKPFSPVSFTGYSKANVLEEATTAQDETIKKIISTNEPAFTTPLKKHCIVDEENRTPKAMQIPVPTTPSTVSVPMQTAFTPAPLPVSKSKEVAEEIEYSFEERRAGFVLPRTHIKSIQV